jgi:hypothetical protein
MSFDKRWPMPYGSRMDRPMEAGQMVTVKGEVLDLGDSDDAPALVINLAGDGRGSDAANVPLHCSIRFAQKKIVLNTKTNGEWGEEKHIKNPFKSGSKVDLRIRAHGDHFEITVDGKDLAKYEHRVPLSTVNHVYVNGPMALHNVMFGGKYYSVPYESKFGSGDFGTGKRLFLSGTPEKKGERFDINLVCDNGDIALHLNPRMHEKAVVRNSKKNGEWENEEREIDGSFPFKADISFDLVIVNESYSFQIFLNDAKLCSFAHRMDPNTIRGVQVNGDLELMSLTIV